MGANGAQPLGDAKWCHKSFGSRVQKEEKLLDAICRSIFIHATLVHLVSRRGEGRQFFSVFMTCS